MPSTTTTVTTAAADGTTKTVTTTVAAPDPAPPAAAPEPAPEPAEPAAQPASWTQRDSAWSAPGIAEDPVGPNGGGVGAVLVKRPDPLIDASCFEYKDRPVPELKPGQVLVKNLLISIDPTHRIWMSSVQQYMPSVGLGTVMRALGIGVVEKTTDAEACAVGTIVAIFSGVQEYSVVDIVGGVNPVLPGVPLSCNLSVFSMVIGHTAWIGTNICEPGAGKTFLVSGAAGAVGSLAAQLGKKRGARVVGVAGSEEKCKWLLEVAKLDGVINYKTEPIAAGIARACPDGIDCYFDNVGGETLNAVLGAANNFCRIACCGAISKYNDLGADGHSNGPSNYDMILMRRITIQGFVVPDHAGSIMESMGELGEMLKAGELQYKEDVRECKVSDYHTIVTDLYNGGNKGKLMMRIAPDPQ